MLGPDSEPVWALRRLRDASHLQGTWTYANVVCRFSTKIHPTGGWRKASFPAVDCIVMVTRRRERRFAWCPVGGAPERAVAERKRKPFGVLASS